MNSVAFTRMSNEINRRLHDELRDRILDNMNLKSGSTINTIVDYIDRLDSNSLINLCNVAEVLDWQVVSRIISIVGETYTYKEV